MPGRPRSAPSLEIVTFLKDFNSIPRLSLCLAVPNPPRALKSLLFLRILMEIRVFFDPRPIPSRHESQNYYFFQRIHTLHRITRWHFGPSRVRGELGGSAFRVSSPRNADPPNSSLSLPLPSPAPPFPPSLPTSPSPPRIPPDRLFSRPSSFQDVVP